MTRIGRGIAIWIEIYIGIVISRVICVWNVALHCEWEWIWDLGLGVGVGVELELVLRLGLGLKFDLGLRL